MANLTNINNKFLVQTGGNVGIGSTSPTSPLVVVGTGVGSSGTIGIQGANAHVGFKNSSGTFRSWVGHFNAAVHGSDADLNLKTGYGSVGNIRFTADGDTTAAQMFLQGSTGNLGIGTTSPSTLLSNSSVRNAAASGLSTSLKGLNIEVPAGGNSQGYVASFANTQTASNNYNAGVLIEVGSTDTTTRLLSVESGGTNRFEVRGDGNLGIGTTSPDAKLSLYHATDDVSINVNTGTGGSYPKKTGISFGAISTSLGGDAEFKGGAGIQVINTAASNNVTDMAFWTTSGGSPSEKMRIKSNGKVGIGTENAQNAELAIKSGSNVDLELFSEASGTAWQSYNRTSSSWGYIRFIAGGGEQMRIHTNGNVGIGTTSPASTLEVDGNIQSDTTSIANSAAYIRGADVGIGIGQSASSPYGSWIQSRRNTDGVAFPLSLNPSGSNVGIGTTAPAYKLEVAGTIGTEDRLAIQQTNFGYSSTYKVVQYGETGSTKAISLGYNPSSNTNGGFSGNEILIPNNIRILAPNAADNQFYGVMMFNSSDKLLIGSSNYLIDSNFIMCLDPATKNVGIGTNSPGAKLDVNGATYVRNVIYGYAGAGNQYGGLSWAGTDEGFLFLKDSNVTKVIINSNGNSYLNGGNVGIGTTSPDFKLQIEGGTNTEETVLKLDKGVTGDTGGHTTILGLGTESGGWAKAGIGFERTGSYDRGKIHFLQEDTATTDTATLSDSVMSILPSGNVGIGTSAPDGNLEVIASATVSGASDSVNNVLIGLQAANRPTIILDTADTTYTNRTWNITNVGSAGSLFFGRNGLDVLVMKNDGNVGIGTTTPQNKLDVRGVITAGDSTTDNTIRRKHQSFATMKPGPTSGGSVDMMFVDHTHALDITVMAYVNTSNVATGRGYSVAAYGSTSTGLTQTAFAGVISALSISYVNTGGSENYVLRVTTTYSGATAPVLSVTATGQSSSKLRAAT
jgi:hypothetical protein